MIFRCKMCGAALKIESKASIATCDYCGTTQTLPKIDDEKRANLYDRANHFRRNNEFDKAMSIYEQILNEDNSDAEAYWSLILCRYGIEYVEDPASHKRIPTVNRAQFTSIFDDDNYKSALQYADRYQCHIYEEEAKAINEIQKGILAISQKEEPFDVFVCYKETDHNGRRTPDSVLANDLYHQLTQEGFKVFFARITLENKLGSAYEPYIFAALNSAKVMVVIGTKPEYFNAVWVKNEWSRYLALIKQGQKKMLIPAYRDMDPYDLPEEFSHLQAQDMSKLGFMQDLIHGIKKLAQKDQAEIKEESSDNSRFEPLLRRAFIFLEDGDFETADKYFEKVLDLEPECATAYLGKLMIDMHVMHQDDLKNCENPFSDNINYKKIIRFADDTLRAKINDWNLNIIYTQAKEELSQAHTEEDCKRVASEFSFIANYRDSSDLVEKCHEKAIEYRKEEEERLKNKEKDAILYQGKAKMIGDSYSCYKSAIEYFNSIKGWKNADDLATICQDKINELEIKRELIIKEEIKIQRKARIITLIVLTCIAAFVFYAIFGGSLF